MRVPMRLVSAAATAGLVAVVAIVLLATGRALQQAGADQAGGVAARTGQPGSVAPSQEAAGPTPLPSSASPATSARASPSPDPGTITPAPGPLGAPEIAVVEAVAIPWVDPLGEVRAQVVASVENIGDGPARLPSAESSYTITDAGGRAVAGGLFAHAFPPVLEPGETGYFIDTLSATFVDIDDVVAASVDVVYVPGESGIPQLDVSDVDWVETIDGILVSGSVTNSGSQPVEGATVAVILHGADDRILGAVYDLTDIGRLAAGETRPFSSGYPGTAPTDADLIVDPVALAFGSP